MRLQASDPSEATVAAWEGNVVARHQVAGSGDAGALKRATVVVSDPSGKVLATVDEPLRPDLAIASATGRASVDGARLAEAAALLGVEVTSIQVWPEHGGAVEMTFTADDPAELVEKSPQVAPRLLAGLAGTAATLVRYVDRDGAPLVVVGLIPGGIGDGASWGIGWQAPGINASAIRGAEILGTSGK